MVNRWTSEVEGSFNLDFLFLHDVRLQNLLEIKAPFKFQLTVFMRPLVGVRW